jgi:hypothetical protein
MTRHEELFWFNTNPDSILLMEVKEETISEHPEVYPNPSSDFVYLKLHGSYKITKVIVRNAMGQIFHVPVSMAQHTVIKLGISNLTAGVYFVDLFSDQVKRRVKFIVN